MSKFILDNKGNKLSDFCVRCVLKFNFDNKNIFKLKELAKDKSEKLKPGYFSKICGTTGLFIFLIKDALEYCGAVEDKKTPPSRIKSNYLYAKTVFDGINKCINFLEGFVLKKKSLKLKRRSLKKIMLLKSKRKPLKLPQLQLKQLIPFLLFNCNNGK